MRTSDLGRLGEAAVVAEFVRLGYEVFHPLFGNASCDLIVVKDGITSRVEVKATNGIEVGLRQVRHNRSKIEYKKFNADNSEILAIYSAPQNKVLLLKSAEYHGRSSVIVRT